MANVVFESVGKDFGSEAVLRDVDFEVPSGGFVALIGPSGCGKSTLLRMIAGLEHIDYGEIYIDGKAMNDLAPKDRNVAMVFQNYALYPHMTVAENMLFSLRMARSTRAESNDRMWEAARILAIEDLLDRYPRHLSGGQRQRVAMGRAIVRDPKVFLFDEPLSNLDAKLRVQMRAEIKRLHQRLGTTMIFVTHDQVEAMTMADQVIILREGRVEQTGTPLELYDRPANIFVAGFIGSPAMNLALGTFERASHDLCFVPQGGSPIPFRKVRCRPRKESFRAASTFWGCDLNMSPWRKPTRILIAAVLTEGFRQMWFSLRLPVSTLSSWRPRSTERSRSWFEADSIQPPGLRLMLRLNLPLAHVFEAETGVRVVV